MLHGALVSLAVLLPGKGFAQSGEVAELADLPFEQLLHTEVITAEKLARQISDAPSAVSIVTAQDIRDFGYRSLSDILDSMRGLSMSHDSRRGFLSGRGYANAGSNSGRLTLLIDGYRATDGLFGRTYFGTDGLLDVDLIERVEYIPGNGSSSYGDSAFLGVVNIVTKKGGDIGGTQVATGLGSHGWSENRVTFGRQFDNGLDLVLSVSDMDSNGRHPEQSTVYPNVVQVEQYNNQRLFLKAGYAGWTFEAAQVKRQASVPIDVNFREPDVNSFARLKYNGDLGEHLKTTLDFYYGHYRTEQYLPLDSWVETYGADWRGVDAKLVGTWFDRHTLVMGTEYRDDFRQNIRAFWYGIEEPTWHFAQSRQTWSLYAYDDYVLTDNLQLNFGGRWDARNNGSETFSPRGAIVYSPFVGTTLKLSTGKANRQQTAFSESWAPNPSVEKLRTRELVWEQMLGPKTRLTTALYQYRIDNFLYTLSDGWVPGNSGPKASKGVEFELEHLWDNGVRVRASYAYLNTYFPEGSPFGRYPANMAHDNVKFNISAPLVGEHLRAGLSVRYLGSRLQNSRDGAPPLLTTYEPGYLVGDLTLSGKAHNWTYGFSIRNLGDTRYNEISEAYDITPQLIYPADRRNFWFQLGYEFK
jgi:iron complex outermembrane receptor protein